jgi:hypothetical protein
MIYTSVKSFYLYTCHIFVFANAQVLLLVFVPFMTVPEPSVWGSN